MTDRPRDLPRSPVSPLPLPGGETAALPGGFEVLWRRDPDPPPRVDPDPAPVVLSGADDEVGDPAPAAILLRVLGRLLGDAGAADALATEVLGGESVDAASALDVALATVLEQRGPLGESRVLRIEGVTFADHRSRIARDLLRWDPTRRLVLVLRHLAELSCSQVAVVVGWTEPDVRAVTAAWRPHDLDPALDGTAGRPLAHLDPPRPFRT